MKKLLYPLAAFSLVAAPVAAQSLPTFAPVEDGSELGGEGGDGTVIAALLALGIVAIAALAIADNDDDEAVSP